MSSAKKSSAAAAKKHAAAAKKRKSTLLRNLRKNNAYLKDEVERLRAWAQRAQTEVDRVSSVLGPFQVALLAVLRPVLSDYESRIEALEKAKGF